MYEQLGTPVAVIMLRETWHEKGIDAHCVYLVSQHVNAETGETAEFHQLLDAHTQEAVARKCIRNWSKHYNVPEKAFINLRKAVSNGK